MGIIGRKIEARPDEVLVKRPDGTYAFPRKVESFKTNSQISPENYALVQEGNEARYTINMEQRFGGLQQTPAIVKALKEGVFVPSIGIFIPHYRNVNDAQKNKGVLYDASGNLIEGERLDKYANRLNYNCWAWLNATFPKEQNKTTGFLGLDLVVITGLDKDNQPIFLRAPLETCLAEDCFVELGSLNSQGFPTEKASVQKYEPGETFRFWYPRENCGARFFANSGRSGLYCNWYPADAGPRLGVRHVRKAHEKK